MTEPADRLRAILAHYQHDTERRERARRGLQLADDPDERTLLIAAALWHAGYLLDDDTDTWRPDPDEWEA